MGTEQLSGLMFCGLAVFPNLAATAGFQWGSGPKNMLYLGIEVLEGRIEYLEAVGRDVSEERRGLSALQAWLQDHPSEGQTRG